MTKMLVDIDDEALEAAKVALGTNSAEDTVNTALREAVAVRRRANAMAKLNAYGESGYFDALLDKENYRPRVKYPSDAIAGSATAINNSANRANP